MSSNLLPVQASDIRDSPASSECPAAPPPSLASSRSSATYSRRLLLMLQTPNAQPPAPDRLQSFSSILRRQSGDWGVDEESSTLLVGEPIAKSFPIHSNPETIHPWDKRRDSDNDTLDLLFDFNSAPPKPVMIDFSNPDPFETRRKASAVFQAFPSSNFSSDTLVEGNGLAVTLGEKFTTLRLGSRSNSISSRSSSPSVSASSRDSFSAVPLNPFAAPWPLPDTTPKIPVPNGTKTLTRSLSISPPDVSLPLPKLPASLPPKPNVELPPVFVKRESAALPQPMALPDVAPLGHAWRGENSMSGNDKRRRASQMGLPPLPLDMPQRGLGVGMRGGMGGSLEEKRPERLIKLGERLRVSVSAHGRRGTPYI